MPRSLERRIIIITLALLLGATITEGVKTAWFPQLSGFLSFLTTLIAASLATLIGILLAEHIPNTQPSTELKEYERKRLEANLIQLNRELEESAKAQTSELARLNLELDLQIAMHRQAEDIARTSEERFRKMADNIQEGLTIIENGRLVYVNERACEIFGECPEGDLLQRIKKFALPQEADRLQQLIGWSAGGVSAEKPFPSELQYWIRRPDGSQRCIREHYSSNYSQQAQRIFVVTFDVTERVQAVHTLEQAVNDRTRELSAVLEISKKIASTLELEPLLNLILDQIQSIIPYSGAAIFTLEDDSLRVISYVVPYLPVPNRPLWLTLTNAGYYYPVLQEKKVVIIDDVRGESPLAQAFRESLTNQQSFSFAYARSWIGIPLVIRDHVTGLMSLTYNEPGFYTQRHARLAETITNQIAVAIENARLYEQAQNLATLEERNRIARELHDSVTQLLYGICLYSTATTRSIRNENFSQVEQNLVEIKEDALQALQEMRLLILELNPPLLQKEGLVVALQASLDAIETRTGLETELRTDGIGRLPRVIEPELYRIAMEALNNLVRYARAKKVTVDLHARGGWVFLEICDNGIGFDREKTENSGGMGLYNMEQRAHQLGGRLEITSSPGIGTKIRAEIPAQERWAEPA
jgi:PAS domain S-box-containing protein